MVQIGKPETSSGSDLAKILGQNADNRLGGTSAGDSKAERGRDGQSLARTDSGKIEISAEARARAEREEALQVLHEAYRGLEGIRRDVVETVRQRIEAGYYESEDVLSQVAERLVPIIKS
jgi:hypothetical protein